MDEWLEDNFMKIIVIVFEEDVILAMLIGDFVCIGGYVLF